MDELPTISMCHFVSIFLSKFEEASARSNLCAAGAMFGSLKSTLCARQVKLTLKGKIYRTLVVSILLYGCESWALTAETRRMLVSFHRRCVRRMHRITLKHT